MQRHACVLLSLIGNCGEIRWTYPQDGAQVQGSLNREQATQLLGKAPAEFAQSPQTVQELLDILWPLQNTIKLKFYLRAGSDFRKSMIQCAGKR